MTSLRRRLFVILIAATGLIWVCAAAWITIGSRSELERVLDTRLQEAARMVHSLVATRGEDAGSNAAVGTISPGLPGDYERQLSCQIWSLSGRLIAQSSGAPDGAMGGERDGFSDRKVDGEVWRVYTIVDPEKGVRVVVGDRIGLRDKLVRDLATGLAAPALLAMPILGLLIWISLGQGLRPLRRVAEEIARREGEDMRPVPPGGAPVEIRPLIGALNGLFAKVETARRHERDVTAFAAHELRTPLAGLKTQAQVALMAEDATIRENALRQILVSVDRTGRLVRQLLALARLEPGAGGPVAAISLGAAVRDVVATVPRPDAVDVRVAPGLDAVSKTLDRDALASLLRNLHENALAHSPAGGTVTWTLDPTGRSLRVEDDGPGIPADELDLVRQRFYRGRQSRAIGAPGGTGLGLTIADMAARRIGARLSLRNRSDGSGLVAQIDFG
ncbi:ATP-binding protein [Aquabacter spiritensis]|uniref:histidine kinase n=1 Tax=Aquabacter spiritensis TaxID=933073 RepID=A0A4R3M372_9HYPH|nr:ATP-binding protein [Aquabacter spiritensis]TCT07674.1 two-component system sensor histidine kinase QseC [Aquabacter spiritensis]